MIMNLASLLLRNFLQSPWFNWGTPAILFSIFRLLRLAATNKIFSHFDRYSLQWL